MMNSRLAPLHLLPPSIDTSLDTSWAANSSDSKGHTIGRRLGSDLSLPLPLFWYDPAWFHVTTQQADFLAVAVAELDIIVSAMQSDVSGLSSDSLFHAGRYARLLPYRAERYGLRANDFDDSTIVDLRLVVARDLSGRFAYCPAQIQRWEATPPSAPLAGGSWVTAATFPPDVVSMEHLASKISQLRHLAVSAAVFVSIGPYRLDDELPSVVAAQPDGLILRLDELSITGRQLAEIVQRTRQKLDAISVKSINGESIPLWVVPGEITADDAVKLIALGASAIAIDSWCNELLEQTGGTHVASVPDENLSTAHSHEYDSRWGDFAVQVIGERIERFRGLLESLQVVAKNEPLGSFDPKWVQSLGVRSLH